MAAEEILEQVKAEFSGRRKFAAGLAVALIDLLLELKVPNDGDISDFDDFGRKYPRKEFLSENQRANTLTVELADGETIGLRPFYNKVEAFFRAQHHRYDYPSCAPHATQAWRDYQNWLDEMCALSEMELTNLRTQICDYVLGALPSHQFDPSTVVREVPAFEAVLSDFDLSSRRGERSGAAYQGVAFGFLRADNPHLQVEIDKVRTGSKRLGRVGDIDAWEGARLAITVEVKQFTIETTQVEALTAFADAANVRGAIGIVCALGFAEGARQDVEALGIRAIDIEDLRQIVSLWDPMKQRVAISSMGYYFSHVEKSSELTTRFDKFIKETMDSVKAPTASVSASTELTEQDASPSAHAGPSD